MNPTPDIPSKLLQLHMKYLRFCAFMGGQFLVSALCAAPPEKKPEPKDMLLLETSKFEFLTTHQGRLVYAVKATQMRHYKSGNVELDGGIEVKILEKKPGHVQQPVHTTSMQAQKLSYHKASKTCILEGMVSVQKPAEELTIATEKLTYDMETEMFSTNAPIEITQRKNSIKGVGLSAHKDLTTYRIGDPNGRADMEQTISSTTESL
jgi:LPS export ABC transporter protein LptC